MTGSSLANRDQAQLWNASAGRAWVEMQDLLDRLFAPVTDTIVSEAFPGDGRRVIDIGCGSGATTFAMAQRLGPTGQALGIDLSETLINAALARARAEGLASPSFIAADAQTYSFSRESADAVISRFGVMFFDDPVAAFVNLRSALRPQGRLVFAAWRSPAENPFMTAAARAAAPLLPCLAAAAPGAPGQFGFSDPERVRRILAAAGWAHIEIKALDVPGRLSQEELAAYATTMGPVGLALQNLDPAEQAPVIERVIQGFAPFREGGATAFDMALWLVTARA